MLSKVNVSVVNVVSGSHNTDCNSKQCNNQRQHWQASPSNGEHGGISEISGPVIGKDGRRHNLRGSPYSRKSKKIRSPLGRAKKARDKVYIKYCCRRSQSCCEWDDSKNYIGNKNHPCIQKWILPSANTGKYCPIILACPLFHSKETVVHTIRPHHTVTLLMPVVILGWCQQGHC